MKTCKEIRCLALLLLIPVLPVFAAKEPPAPRPPLTPGPWASRAERPSQRPAPRVVREAVPGFLFVEAEDFRDYGGWRLDTQFTHKMGSAYLIASGVGSPIADAVATVEVPRSGVWRVWARTKDWLPEFSPGAFAVVVNGREGPRLGVSRRVGWLWECAGDFELNPGVAELRLRDLSGFFGRCDALVLTTDLGYVPPDDAPAMEGERFRLKGEDAAVVERGNFDVVVVGAGPAGVPAAVAAARHGAKVALVGDRPVLGGNASDEIGVNMCGAVVDKPAARETGIAEEAICFRAQFPAPGMSDAYRRLVEAETNITQFLCERVLSAETAGGVIRAVLSRNTMTGVRSRIAGSVFIDATGDGWLGYFAGAKYREGREGQNEFKEEDAPPRPDTMTMSGLLHEPTVGVSYHAEDTGTPVTYEMPTWAKVLPRRFRRKVSSLRGQWWIEHSGFFDDCEDPERARDELIRISFAYWGWLKNESPMRVEALNYVLREIPIMDGRREARRLMGDYILTANDCLKGRIFSDAVAYGGWSLDVHDPLGMSAPDTDGWCLMHPRVPIYTIPFRSLYSVNVSNLMMAGRDLSATHTALGSARVQSTCSVMGQAVGTAAAMCIAEGLSPRELGVRRIGELQRRLLCDDAWIPGVSVDDPLDKARTAKVSASSYASETVRWSPNGVGGSMPAANGDGPRHAGYIAYGGVRPENVVDGVSRPVGTNSHAWVSAPGAVLPQWVCLDFPKPVEVREVRIVFDSDLEFNAWLCRIAEELVKDYVLEGSADGKTWFVLADEKGNFQRHRIHRFAPVRLKALRLTVVATYGSEEANVFAIRVY